MLIAAGSRPIGNGNRLAGVKHGIAARPSFAIKCNAWAMQLSPRCNRSAEAQQQIQRRSHRSHLAQLLED
jgi:hypothetical protein